MYISHSTCIFHILHVYSTCIRYSKSPPLFFSPQIPQTIPLLKISTSILHTLPPSLSLSLSTIFLFTISSPYLHFQSFTLIYVSFLLQSLFLFSNLSPRYITNPALIPSTISLSPLPNHCTSLYKSLLNVNNLPLPTSQTSFNYSYINII